MLAVIIIVFVTPIPDNNYYLLKDGRKEQILTKDTFFYESQPLASAPAAGKKKTLLWHLDIWIEDWIWGYDTSKVMHKIIKF